VKNCLLAAWIQRYYDARDKLWRAIVDVKYTNRTPNLFFWNGRNCSPFWKGVIWAAQAAKMGYKWRIGDGKRVRFWEDQWFGTCSLAIQFWEIYSINNEQGKTIKEAWDGVNLRFTFRRTVDSHLLNQWEELQIASSIELTGEEDSVIWQYNSTGKYSVQSLYAIVNDTGMRQIYTPVMWKIHPPPKNSYFPLALGK
jgi:hypothetical protein